MAQNIIGNTSYGEIKDKKYIDSTAVNIQMLAERLQAENIRFSGRINDWKATITVDGEADKARALQILKEVEALNGNQRMYIGNKQYRYFSDKKITSMSAEEARVIANYLTKNNVVFSGVIEGEKARITVSGDAALADVKRVLDMYRNKDIVKELAAHGYMLVDDKSEDADIINVRDTRHTGEVRGFESLEAVRAALNDINNDFFHPTEYRIATSAYFNDTLYYISASDAVSGEERGAVREAGAAVTFETVSEALSYCENNGITISNSEEDIEKFRILEDDAETKRITAENEKYTAMLDSSVEYTNYDPQNGILKVCYIGEYSGKAAIIENTVTDTDILAAHNNNYANPVDYFTFLDVQSSTRIVSSDEAEYASMADTLLDGNYRKVNRTAEGLEALRHDTEMFCKPIQEQRRAQALKAEDISKLADVIEQTAQHVSDNNALNLFGYGKDFNEGNTADYAFSFNDSLSLRENIVASLESGKTAWLGVWAEEISTHIPAQEYEAVNNALNFFMDKYNCHFNMSDIQHVTYSITLTSDAFDEPYALAVEDIYGDFVDYVKDSNGDIPTFDNVDEAVKYAEMEHIKITNSAAEIEEWRVIDKELKENSDHIKVEGHRGTWYVIDTDIIGGKQLFLLEHETYGDEAAGLIVDKDRNIVMDEVYNGFADLFDAFPELEPQEEPENKQPDMNNSVTNSQTAKTLPETRFTSISQKTRGYLNFHTFIAMPEDSPWGEVQVIDRLANGVFEVSTASHGGIMVKSDIADKIFSKEARDIAFKENGFMCFEEDCDATVAYRELIDKGIIEYPSDYNGSNADFDETINHAISYWFKDYWNKREEAIFKALPAEEQAEQTGQIMFGESAEEPVADNSPVGNSEYEGLLDAIETKHHIATTALLVNNYDLALRTLNEELELTEKAEKIRKSMPQHPLIFSVKQNDMTEYRVAEGLTVEDIKKIYAQSDRPYYALMQTGEPISEARFAEIEQSDRYGVVIDIDIDNGSMDIDTVTKRSVSLSDVVGEYKPIELEISDIDDIYMSEEGVYDAILSYTPSLEKVLIENSGLDTTDLRLDTAYLVYDENEDKLSVAEYSFSRGDERVYRETNFEITVSGEQKEKLVKQMKDRYYENEISDEYTPDELDTVLHLADENIGFTVVTLNDDEDFIVGGNVDLDDIKETEDYLEYVAGLDGETTSISVSKSFYTIGADVENNDAEDYQTEYIYNHLEDVLKMATLHEGIRYRVEIERDEEAEEETEEAEPIIEENSELIKALSEHRNIYFEDEPYKEQYVSDANDRRFTNRYFVFDDESSEYVFRGTTSLNGKNEDVYLRPLGSNAANIAQYIAENNLTVREYGEIPAQSEDIPIDPFKDNVAMGDLEENDFIFIPVHTAQNGSVTVPERYALVTEVSESGITLETYSDGDMTNSTGQQRINGDWAAQLENVGAVFVSTYDESLELPENPEMRYEIYQLKNGEAYRDYHFTGFSELKLYGLTVDTDNYDLVYSGRSATRLTAEDIFVKFNLQRPADFTGHSLSVSDVVVIDLYGSKQAFYVDSFGFAEVTDLFLGKERERIEVTDLASIRLREDYDKYVNNNIVFFHNYITFSNIQSENITRDKSFTYIDGTDHDNDEGTTLTSHRAMMSELAAYLETMRNDSARRIEITDLEGNVRTLKSFAFTFEDKTEITRDSRDIEIRGQEGKWRVVDAEVIDGEMLFELERDTGDEKVGTFGTNDTNILVDADKNVREVLIPKGHIAHYRVTQEIDKFRDNFIENRMPEIIRKMLTFDEMSALSDHIFTDYFSYKIGMVQNSIENSGRITVYSPDTDTELSHLHDAMNTDLEIAVSYEKTETGLKFVAANVEKEYTWEQITNFAVRAAEKWYDSSKENSYERMKEYLDNVVQNTNPEFHLTAGTFAVYAADTIVENIYKKYKFGFVDEAERVQESVDNFITNSEMFSHYVDKEVNSLLFNIGVGSTKFVSYGLDEVADLCRDFADNPETREYIINSVTIAVENEIIRRRNELVVDEQTEMKPSTLEIGDIIELDGKQWELYDTGFNVTFINNDPSDPEHSFTHIGGVSNFIETHDFTLIAKGKELEPDKADDTVSESSRVPVEKEAALDLWDNGIDVFINGQRANSRKEIEDCGTQWNEFSVSMVQYDEYSERNTPSEQLAEMEEAIEFPATPAVKDILYTNSYQQAVENGEEDAYVESRRISSDCRRDLDRFIEQYYTDYSLNTSAVIDAILKDYAPERVSFIFASNLAGKGYDGRVSKDNIQWAEAFMQNIPDELREWNGRFALSSHIGLVNLAATEFQKYLERSKEVPAVENEKITLSIDKLGIEVDFTAGQSISISEEWLDGMYDDENEYERKTVFSYNEDDGLNVDVTTTRNGQYWTPNSFDIADYYDNSPVVLDYVRRVVDNSLNRPDVYTLTVYDADGNEIAKSEKEELPEASEQTRAVTSEQQEANAEPKKSMGIVTLRKVGDFYEMYGKNAEIGADVLGITPISQNGGEMLRFAGDVESEYSEKLRDAGYSVLIEQVFELNPPRRNIELQTETERGAENSPVGNSTEQTVTEESHDFVITDDNFNAEGGAKTRFKANVEAIRLLQSIEAENRTATQAEQEILSRYVGWGGLSNAFDATKTDWVYEYSELQTLLSPEEYQAARASTVDAYFTSPVIIGAMYEALQNTGFNGGRILEPSCGSGNFFGAMPEALRDNSALFGVELDSLTARIAKQLYPSADIITSGFESTNFSNGSFDVAVGNVPFGEHIVFDREMKQANLHIHDYFIAKALDKVHEGGIVAFVTSQGTMDKRSPDARQYIAQRADLLGAIRLPVGVFSDIARTDAGTDILFLQKRDRPLDIEPEWLHKTMLENGAEVNAYFASHPEMVLGELKVGINKMYGSIETVCYPIEGADIKEQLQEAIKNIHGEYRAEKRAEEQENLLADVEMKRFSYAVIEDKLYYRGSGNEITEVTGKNVPKIKAMIEIAGTVDKLLTLQVENYGNRNAAEISDAMTELNSQYDRFVEKYGRLSSSVRAMKRDDRTHILKSLEVKDREGNFVRKADIFNKPLINATKITEHVDNAYDALILSLNERLKVDLPYMEQVSGIPADQLIKELEGKIYQNPEKNMQWESADEYLTGNVLHKLEAAEEAGMTANVEALKAVQPERIEAQDISVNIGATWIDPEFIRDFILEKLEPDYTTSRDITVEFCDVTSEWKVDNFKAFNLNNAATKVYGEGSDFNSYRLLELALNKKVPIIKKDKLDEHGYPIRDMNGKLVKEIDRQRTKSAQNKQDKIKKMFKDWIFENPERRKILVDKYNRLFNNMRVREFDGSKLNFVGITNQIQLYPHQKNAIARALHSGNTLLAHEVGAGKSATRS